MPRRKTTETDALSTRQLSPNKAKASILHALKIKRPIFVWGGPGIGPCVALGLYLVDKIFD